MTLGCWCMFFLGLSNLLKMFRMSKLYKCLDCHPWFSTNYKFELINQRKPSNVIDEHCYDQSVKTKKICKKAFVTASTYVNELLNTSNGFTILMGVLCLIALLLYLLQLAINHLENNNWWLANFGGTAENLVSLIVFLGGMIKLNHHTFDVKSFCLMNNNETLCRNKYTLLGYNQLFCNLQYREQ